mgnify:CR=1 FL=1
METLGQLFKVIKADIKPKVTKKTTNLGSLFF